MAIALGRLSCHTLGLTGHDGICPDGVQCPLQTDSILRQASPGNELSRREI